MDKLTRFTFSYVKDLEKRQHRPNQMLFLALAIGLIAGMLAAACVEMTDEYFTTLHETATGSLLP